MKINKLLQSKNIANVSLGLSLINTDNPNDIKVRFMQKDNPYSTTVCIYVQDKRYRLYIPNTATTATLDYTHKRGSRKVTDISRNHTIGAMTRSQLDAALGILQLCQEHGKR